MQLGEYKRIIGELNEPSNLLASRARVHFFRVQRLSLRGGERSGRGQQRGRGRRRIYSDLIHAVVYFVVEQRYVFVELGLGFFFYIHRNDRHLLGQKRPQMLQINAVFHDYNQRVRALQASALAVLYAKLVADHRAVFVVVEVDRVLEHLAVQRSQTGFAY